jgi:hypothetical protein
MRFFNQANLINEILLSLSSNLLNHVNLVILIDQSRLFFSKLTPTTLSLAQETPNQEQALVDTIQFPLSFRLLPLVALYNSTKSKHSS